jgi:hypothetical protein
MGRCESRGTGSCREGWETFVNSTALMEGSKGAQIVDFSVLTTTRKVLPGWRCPSTPHGSLSFSLLRQELPELQKLPLVIFKTSFFRLKSYDDLAHL